MVLLEVLDGRGRTTWVVRRGSPRYRKPREPGNLVLDPGAREAYHPRHDGGQGGARARPAPRRAGGGGPETGSLGGAGGTRRGRPGRTGRGHPDGGEAAAPGGGRGSGPPGRRRRGDRSTALRRRPAHR